MKQILILLICFLIHFGANAQKLYGIVRKNFYTLVTNPLDSTFTPFERYDSSTIRLGELNTASGLVSNISQYQFNMALNLTGAALNPFDNSFVFVGGNKLHTFELSNGQLVNSAEITNGMGSSYFDNFRFCHADSNMYGLARRVLYDPITATYTGEVYLAQIDTKSGAIKQISSNSIAPGYALAGSAIDPYQMVYYFSTGQYLLGLDLYTGNVFSKSEINIPGGGIFDNFTYSCADNNLYGLVRKNYFSYYPDPFNPTDSFAQFDSSVVKLATIDANTGNVNIRSPYAVSKGGYSLNAGSAIDPQSMIFYFNPGNSIVGVSLVSGLKTSEQSLSFENGDYFDLMRNFENCRTAYAKRKSSAQTSVKEALLPSLNVTLYPNPASTFTQISSEYNLVQIQLFDGNGKLVMTQLPNSKNVNISLSHLPQGLYFLKVTTDQGSTAMKKLIICHGF